MRATAGAMNAKPREWQDFAARRLDFAAGCGDNGA